MSQSTPPDSTESMCPGKTQSPKTYHVGTLTYTMTGIVILFAWLLWGDFAWSMKERAVGSIAALLVKSFGISDFVYGLLIVSFPSFTNIILGPIISYKSDRHRGRLGRRIPFLIFTTPFVVVGIIGMGFAPMLGRWLQGVVGPEQISYHTAALIAFGLFWVILDFGTTLTNGIFTALMNDVVPSCFLGRFFALFRAISLGAGILFNYWLLGKVEEYSLYMCLGLGILYAIGLSLLCIKVKEGQYPPPELPGENSSTAGTVFTAVKTYFKESFSHPYYRWVFGSFTLCNLTNLPINIFTIFYAKSLNMDMAELGKCLAITYVISFVLCYLLGELADRFHPLRMTAISIALYGLVMLAGGIFTHDKSTFAIFLIAHGVAAGTFNTLSASFTMRLFPKSRFAQFSSAMGMLMAFAWTLAAPVLGKILDWTGNRYVFTFWAGLIISVLALLSLGVVYRYFKRYGGYDNYQAPAPLGDAAPEKNSR